MIAREGVGEGERDEERERYASGLKPPQTKNAGYVPAVITTIFRWTLFLLIFSRRVFYAQSVTIGSTASDECVNACMSHATVTAS